MSDLKDLPQEVLDIVVTGDLEPLLDLAQDLAVKVPTYIAGQVGAFGPLAPVAIKLVEYAVKHLSEALRAEYPAAVHAKKVTFTGFEKVG